jgi:hypothetical protein
MHAHGTLKAKELTKYCIHWYSNATSKSKCYVAMSLCSFSLGCAAELAYHYRHGAKKPFSWIFKAGAREDFRVDKKLIMFSFHALVFCSMPTRSWFSQVLLWQLGV